VKAGLLIGQRRVALAGLKSCASAELRYEPAAGAGSGKAEVRGVKAGLLICYRQAAHPSTTLFGGMYARTQERYNVPVSNPGGYYCVNDLRPWRKWCDRTDRGVHTCRQKSSDVYATRWFRPGSLLTGGADCGSLHTRLYTIRPAGLGACSRFCGGRGSVVRLNLEAQARSRAWVVGQLHIEAALSVG
jgi:hypothetical protein